MANRDNIWTNKDGLNVGFGTRDVDTNAGGKVSLGGNRQQVVMKINATELSTAATTGQLENSVVIPAGALLESAKLVVDTAFTGGTSLDIGVYNAATDAAVDDDGIASAILTATLVAGYNTACAGALIGTVLANNSKIGANYNTSAFTAGVATVVVEYTTPAN